MKKLYIILMTATSLFFLGGALCIAQPYQETAYSDLVVIFNQPVFAAGDTAYFAASFTRGAASKRRVVVGIMLMSPKAELLDYQRVLFENGGGRGQVILPENLAPGACRIVFLPESASQKNTQAMFVLDLPISGKDSEPVMKGTGNPYPASLSSFKIAISDSVFSTRSKVVAGVTRRPNAGDNARLLSVSVYNAEMFQKQNGIVPSACFSISPEEIALPEKALHPEGAPLFFSGQVFERKTGNPIANSVITFYLGRNDLMYALRTGEGGRFYFPLFMPFESQEIFYQVRYNGKDLDDCAIVPFTPEPDPGILEVENKVTADPYGLYASQKKAIDASYKFFMSGKAKTRSSAGTDEWTDADHEIYLEKFAPFPSMAEVIRNIVPMVRCSNTVPVKVKVFLQHLGKYGLDDPLFIVDGVMTDDTDRILRIDPASVRKISVLRSKETLGRFGDLGQHGILVIETNAKSFDAASAKNVISVIGISPAIPYRNNSISVLSGDRRVPNLRSCLYWDNDISDSETSSIEFYTSDDPGDYIIELTGLKDGQVFIERALFKVQKNLD